MRLWDLEMDEGTDALVRVKRWGSRGGGGFRKWLYVRVYRVGKQLCGPMELFLDIARRCWEEARFPERRRMIGCRMLACS